MTERFIIDDCGTLIDMSTRDTYDYVSDVCSFLNELSEENEHLKEELADANELNRIYVDFLVDKGFELSDVVEWSKKELI